MKWEKNYLYSAGGGQCFDIAFSSQYWVLSYPWTTITIDPSSAVVTLHGRVDCQRSELVHYIINLLLTECEGRTGEYWPEVVTVRTERSEVRTKTTGGQYSPVWPEQARLVSSLLYGTLFLIVKCTSGGLHLKNVRLVDQSLKFRKKFNHFSFCW